MAWKNTSYSGMSWKMNDRHQRELRLAVGELRCWADHASLWGKDKRAEDRGVVVNLHAIELEQAIFERGKQCYWCDTPLVHGTRTLDHYLPLSRGGPHIIENIVFACRSCNSKKNDRDPIEYGNLIGRPQAPEMSAAILKVAGVLAEQYIVTRKTMRLWVFDRGNHSLFVTRGYSPASLFLVDFYQRHSHFFDVTFRIHQGTGELMKSRGLFVPAELSARFAELAKEIGVRVIEVPRWQEFSERLEAREEEATNLSASIYPITDREKRRIALDAGLARMGEALQAGGAARSAYYIDDEGRLVCRLPDGAIEVLKENPASFNAKP